MSRIKFILTVAFFCLGAAGTVEAQVGWRPYHRYYYGYGPPVYAYPPVVVPPPGPVIVPPPAYTYPAPAYPAPVYPAPGYVAPAPIYAPPAYGYGMVGPRNHFGFGYATPGFGVYIGR